MAWCHVLLKKQKRKNTMKKLLIVAAALVTAAYANAAAVSWKSGTITLADDTTAGKDAVSAYLFLVDATTYATYSSYTDGKALSDAVYSAYGSKTATASATATTSKKGIATLTDPTDYSAGSTVYGIILYTEGDNYMGNFATASVDGTMDVDVTGLALKISGDTLGTTSTAWSTAAVPEPTSGLLLLLGMAGLALKRKRA